MHIIYIYRKIIFSLHSSKRYILHSFSSDSLFMLKKNDSRARSNLTWLLGLDDYFVGIKICHQSGWERREIWTRFCHTHSLLENVNVGKRMHNENPFGLSRDSSAYILRMKRTHCYLYVCSFCAIAIAISHPRGERVKILCHLSSCEIHLDKTRPICILALMSITSGSSAQQALRAQKIRV